MDINEIEKKSGEFNFSNNEVIMQMLYTTAHNSVTLTNILNLQIDILSELKELPVSADKIKSEYEKEIHKKALEMYTKMLLKEFPPSK